jgi:hypothetical protein
VTRTPLSRDDLAPLARAALGRDRPLASVTRLRGGSRKGVYRLTRDDGSTAIAYVRSADEATGTPGPPTLETPCHPARASASSRPRTTG